MYDMNHEDYGWKTFKQVNEWTGEVKVRQLRRFSDNEAVKDTEAEVYRLGDTIYWFASIYVAHRPDLTRLASGHMEDQHGALAVAKATASQKCVAAIAEYYRTKKH